MVQWWRVKISKMNFKLNALRLFVISAIISAHIVDTADNVTEMDSALVLQNASLTAFPMSFAVHRRAYAKISYGRGYPISLECDGSVGKFSIYWSAKINREIIHFPFRNTMGGWRLANHRKM